MTLSFDHAIIDAMPAAKSTSRPKGLGESGYGLEKVEAE